MEDVLPLMLTGGGFVVLAVALLLWGRREKRRYRDVLAGGPDMREYLTNWPPRWWLHTLTIGGLISLAVGAVLLVMGLFSA